MNSLASILSLFLLVYSSLLNADPICAPPQDDLQTIEKLFKYLMFEEGFAYTLFGSKPMSTIGFDKSTPIEYQEEYAHPLFELEDWWNTWIEYQDLFPMENYRLFSTSHDSWFEVFLINTSLFKNVVDSHLALFEMKLKHPVNSNELLDQLTSSSHIFAELESSHALYGVLLGYGTQNALSFEKRCSKKRRFHIPWPPGSTSGLRTQQTPLIPHFASFQQKETWAIMKRYQKEQELIRESYSSGAFLPITLDKLTQ